MSFIGPYGKLVIAVLIAALGTIDMANVLPVSYDNMLEGFIYLLAGLSGTPTRPFDPQSGRTVEALPNATLTPK